MYTRLYIYIYVFIIYLSRTKFLSDSAIALICHLGFSNVKKNVFEKANILFFGNGV